MAFRIDHYHHFDGPDAKAVARAVVAAITPFLDAQGKQIMAAIDDAAAALTTSVADLTTSVAAAVARNAADVAASTQLLADMTAQRDALQAEVDAGNNNPVVLQALTDANAAIAAAKTTIDQIDATTPSTLPPTP